MLQSLFSLQLPLTHNLSNKVRGIFIVSLRFFLHESAYDYTTLGQWKFTFLIISVLFVNFQSVLSEFDFDGYISLIMNIWCIYDSSLPLILLHDNAWPHVARMTILGHILSGWHCRYSLTWDMGLCLIHRFLLIFHPFFQAFGQFFTISKEKCYIAIIQIQADSNTQADSLLFRYKLFIIYFTSVLPHKERDTILKSLSYHTMLTTPPTFTISIHLHWSGLKKLHCHRNSRKLNSPCPNGRLNCLPA